MVFSNSQNIENNYSLWLGTKITILIGHLKSLFSREVTAFIRFACRMNTGFEISRLPSQGCHISQLLFLNSWYNMDIPNCRSLLFLNLHPFLPSPVPLFTTLSETHPTLARWEVTMVRLPEDGHFWKYGCQLFVGQPSRKNNASWSSSFAISETSINNSLFPPINSSSYIREKNFVPYMGTCRA